MTESQAVAHFVESVVQSILTTDGIAVRLANDAENAPRLEAQRVNTDQLVSVQLSDYELSDAGIAELVADLRTLCGQEPTT